MATPKRRSTREDSGDVSELTKKLSELQMENRKLKKMIKGAGPSGPATEILTQKQKDVLIAQVSGKLVTKAMSKIEEKVRSAVNKAVTKAEAQAAVNSLNFRIQLSYSETGEPTATPASRRRAKSKTRDVDADSD